MAFLHARQIGEGQYLYGINSYRNGTKTRNKQIIIGLIDKEKNILKINNNFNDWISENKFTNDDIIQFLARKGFINIIIENFIDNNEYKGADKHEKEHKYTDSEVISSIRNSFGGTYLLYNICDKIGLIKILKSIFPNNYEKIITILLFQVSTQDQAYLCSHWMKKTYLPYNCELLTSQKISNLYNEITCEEIHNFYQKWSDYVTENEFLACDITSFSSYTSNIDGFTFGHNRDLDKLRQTNLCLLFGETSGLPVFSVRYHGSLNDVRTLCTTIELLKTFRKFQFKLVTDKGFYSKENIDYLLSRDIKIPFLIGASATTTLYQEIVNNNFDMINDLKNSINLGKDLLFHRTIKVPWSKTKLYAHLYLNLGKYFDSKLHDMYNLNEMLELALSDPIKYKSDKKFRKFFTFRKIKNIKKYTVKMKNNIVETIKKSGWFLLLSDHIKDPKIAIKVYRNKNVVEEAFSRIKNYIKSKKLRVHSNEAVNSKLFINFISLILISSLHNTMENSGLYKKYTIIEMIHELNLFEVSLISGKKIFHPVNSNQKKIFETFKCLYPEILNNKS